MASGNIVTRKLKNGKLRYEITVDGGIDPITGKRVRAYKTVKTEKEAKSLMHKMICDMEKGIVTRRTSKSVGDWMDEWLALYLPNIAQTTRKGYMSKIKDYIKPAIGNLSISVLRAHHVQTMVNNMTARGLSPKNIRDTFNNVNAAMKKAVVLHMIPYNPCEGVVLPKLKKYKAKVYDTDMIHHLLEVAKGTDMYIPLLLLTTAGLRRGELVALRWEDVDFKRNILKIRRSMVNGLDGVIIKDPKSESGIRDIHVGKEVMEELRKARVQYLNDALTCGYGFQNLDLVVRQEDGSPVKPDSMTQKWERFLKKYNLPKIRLHDLRHSNATALIQAGVSPKVVQQRLGHSDVNITLNTYTHVLPEMDIEAAEKLDDIILKKA